MIHVADILDYFGISHNRCRCACPVHGGDNPMSFSFADEVYNCFACGAKGNVITLVEHLQGTDRKGAVKFLCERMGVTDFDYKPQVHRVNSKRSPVILREPTELFILNRKMDRLQHVKIAFTEHLVWIRQKYGDGLIDSFHYENKVCEFDKWLQEIDQLLIELNYEIRTAKKGIDTNAV